MSLSLNPSLSDSLVGISDTSTVIQTHRVAIARAGFVTPVVIAAILNCWNLSINGSGNTYYSSAILSMTKSWRNFFFIAFDPGGFISIDKPPVALWIEAAAARVFGISSLTLLLPAAIAGTASVALL